jgi:hypothetical protein
MANPDTLDDKVAAQGYAEGAATTEKKAKGLVAASIFLEHLVVEDGQAHIDLSRFSDAVAGFYEAELIAGGEHPGTAIQTALELARQEVGEQAQSEQAIAQRMRATSDSLNS